MTADGALALAREHGVSIWVAGDRLILSAPPPPPEVVLDVLRETKPALLVLLAQPSPDTVIPFPPVAGCFCSLCARRRLLRKARP